MKSDWYDQQKHPEIICFSNQGYLLFWNHFWPIWATNLNKGFHSKKQSQSEISARSFPRFGWWICCSGMKLFRNWEYKRRSLHSVTIQEKESCINGVTEWKTPRQPVNLERHILGLKRTTGYVHIRFRITSSSGFNLPSHSRRSYREWFPIRRTRLNRCSLNNETIHSEKRIFSRWNLLFNQENWWFVV